jgi:hypothetical protein
MWLLGALFSVISTTTLFSLGAPNVPIGFEQDELTMVAYQMVDGQ